MDRVGRRNLDVENLSFEMKSLSMDGGVADDVSRCGGHSDHALTATAGLDALTKGFHDCYL